MGWGLLGLEEHISARFATQRVGAGSESLGQEVSLLREARIKGWKLQVPSLAFGRALAE